MQITDSVICDTSKGSIYMYKQIKPPLVCEHAFPLMGFVCESANVTFGGQRWDKVNCQTGVALPMCFPGQVPGHFSEGEVM